VIRFSQRGPGFAEALIAQLRGPLKEGVAGLLKLPDTRHAGEHAGVCAMCKDGRVTVIA
jgi:hypothetical protein